MPKGCLPFSVVIIMISVVCLNILQVVSSIVCGYLVVIIMMYVVCLYSVMCCLLLSVAFITMDVV